MDVFMARQPIFDAHKEIYAYELLFRGSIDNIFPDIDGECATSRLLSNTFFTADIEKITDGKHAFINFTHELLIRGIPLMFPPEITTVEVLEDVRVDAALLESLTAIASQGYCIALDDFQYTPEMEPLITLCDIIKVDFRLSSPAEILGMVERFRASGIRLLAEKVETDEEFRQALSMGFTYFQGYFFSRPQVMKERDIPTLQVNLLQIMSETGGRDFSVPRLSSLIERDVGVSYKLLRYMNSPYYRRVCEITSIRHAIVMLGETGIKRFLSVIVLAELSQDKPDELLRTSLIRAKLCESLAGRGTFRPNPSELFTTGLFSLIDAILDDHMPSIMQKLPLSPNIKRTLLGRATPLSAYLELAVSYERGCWEEATRYAIRLDIPPGHLPALYLDALEWADGLFREELPSWKARA